MIIARTNDRTLWTPFELFNQMNQFRRLSGAHRPSNALRTSLSNFLSISDLIEKNRTQCDRLRQIIARTKIIEIWAPLGPIDGKDITLMVTDCCGQGHQY